MLQMLDQDLINFYRIVSIAKNFCELDGVRPEISLFFVANKIFDEIVQSSIICRFSASSIAVDSKIQTFQEFKIFRFYLFF